MQLKYVRENIIYFLKHPYEFWVFCAIFIYMGIGIWLTIQDMYREETTLERMIYKKG